MTDAEGKVYQHLEYFPFGETWVEENSNTQRTPYLFTAKELDEETGLYYFGARYYDPRTSVWQSPDPILEKYLVGKPSGGVFVTTNLSLYSYGAQNPVRYRDDNGQFVNFLVGAASGAVVDIGMQVAVQVVTGQKIDVDWGQVGVSAAIGATGVGVLQVAKKGVQIYRAQKLEQAAQKAADAAQKLKPRPGAAGAMEKEGKIVEATSKNPEAADLHPKVKEILDEIPAAKRSPSHGGCVEPQCASQLLREGVDPAGATSKVLKVRKPGNAEHGADLPACQSCQHLLERLGIKDAAK